MLSRRQFLQAGSAVAGTIWTEQVLAQKRAAKRVSRVIDTHTHFYDPTRPQGVPWPSASNPVLYRKVMPDELMKLGASHRVIGTIAVEASPWLEDNQWLLDLAAGNPAILGVIGNLQQSGERFQEHLARFSKNPRFKGVRINTPFFAKSDRRQVIASMQAIAGAGLIAEVNGGADGLVEILELKKEVPDLKIVIEHLPKLPSKSLEQRSRDFSALKELADLPDVFAKISYVLKMTPVAPSLDVEAYREDLDLLWKWFGASKVMYGSNWPVSNHVAPYDTIIGLMKEYLADRKQEDNEKFFWRNARTIYRLDLEPF